MQVVQSEKGLIKMWTEFVPVDDNSLEQLKRTANMPFIHKHIAVMPDVHFGMGATVGSVIPTKGAIIPAAVGVDIGCGMMAAKTTLKASDLPDDLGPLRSDIEALIPVGFNQHNQNHVPIQGQVLFDRLHIELEEILTKYPMISKNGALKASLQMGTLGGGNHFVEICLDTDQNVWIMLHSGSRGIGNQIGRYFISEAKELMEKMFIKLEDTDLSYLVEGTELFDDYIKAMDWAQRYAAFNREVMMEQTKDALTARVKPFTIIDGAINCHHNYTTRENHYGQNVWLTRKGAVNARKGVLGIIPGSMGAKSFIVEGKGDEQSFCSCSHGAGRVMSRTQAKKLVNMEQHLKDTAGIECRKDEDVIDETPSAYKNIDDVMKSQEDLVEIKYTLKQVLCVKG